MLSFLPALLLLMFQGPYAPEPAFWALQQINPNDGITRNFERAPAARFVAYSNARARTAACLSSIQAQNEETPVSRRLRRSRIEGDSLTSAEDGFARCCRSRDGPDTVLA